MASYGPEVTIEDPAYIDASAAIYGRVHIGRQASVWPQAVIRAERHGIEIGPYSNIQDFVMLHVGNDHGTRIGAYCSITHHAVVHAATIGDNCLVGIHATVMDGCVIGDNCIIAGGAFLTEATVVPDNSVVVGIPAKVTQSRNNWVGNRMNALIYHRNALAFARGEHRAWEGPAFDAFVAREKARLEAEFAARFGDETGSAAAVAGD